MSLTGTHLPSPTIGQESSPRIKRPTALRVVERVLSLTAIWAVASLTAQAQDYTFTTLAGVAGSSGYNNSTMGDATTKPFFNGPGGVVVDSSGNYFVADSGNHTIRKVTPAGVVTTFAGTGGLAGSVDGTGNAARFTAPRGPAIDSAGNIYVADYGSNLIRKITSAGVVTSLAGNSGFSGSVDGTGTAAVFNGPSSVAVDSAGNVYVADSLNNQIRKVTSAGVVTVFAGSSVAAAGSLDGTGTAASFSRPRGVAVDSTGNVWVADSNNNTIRMITSAGVVKTIAGAAGTYGSTDSTVATSARFDFPCSLAFDSIGNLYIADQANHTIRKLSISAGLAGAVTTVAGRSPNEPVVVGAPTPAPTPGAADNMVGTDARFFRPSGVACDSSGSIIVTDFSNQLIRKISNTANNPVATVAGVAGVVGIQDGTGALLITPSLFASPSATATDAAGNIYVTDTKNQVIRMITPAGVTSTLAGQVQTAGANDTDTANGIKATFNNPAGIAVSKVVNPGNVIVADTGNHLIRVITPGGVVTTLAGSPGVSGSTDDAGTLARFNSPSSVAVDSNGNIYVADYGNHKIRMVTPAGVVSTFAGSGAAGSSDGPGTSASFKFPRGIAIDATSTALYVADTQNHTIRKIDLATREVTTVAGSAGTAASKDATGTSAWFNGPNALAVSSSGVIYVADTNNETIRAISPGGAVTTIASLPGRIGSVDGVGQAVRFNQPTGISVDADGTIYVADARNNTIRRGVSSGGKNGPAGGYDGGAFDNSGNGGSGSGGGGTTPTGNGLVLKPGGIATDTAGNIYVTDTGNNSIKKIVIGSDGQGTVTILAGNDGTAGWADGAGTAASFNGPTGITNDGSNNFYVTDTGNGLIRKVTAAGAVTTFAGSHEKRDNKDGVGTAALFSAPTGIDIDSAGNLYVADAATATIRKITTLENTTTTPTTPAATVTTFAGLAMTTGEADGTGTAARFNGPTGVAVDANNFLYVADTNNNTIRFITTRDTTTAQTPLAVGVVSTLAGAPGISGSFDGRGSYALFSNPTGLGASHSTSGPLVVADTGNNLIRRISGGNVTTYAGIAGIASYRDGTSNTALFNQPKAVAIGGRVLVADTANSSIRIVSDTTVTGLILKKPATTTTPDPTPTPTPSSSGGGMMEYWFSAAVVALIILCRRERRTVK